MQKGDHERYIFKTFLCKIPPPNFDPRHGQWGISMNAFDLGIWKRKDLTWWLE
jgi:hypothetical protein